MTKTRLINYGSPNQVLLKNISFYYFIQYHLHLQLKEAADYAHKKGIVLKGDIPIGIYRYGCDAWVAPELYNMNDRPVRLLMISHLLVRTGDFQHTTGNECRKMGLPGGSSDLSK